MRMLIATLVLFAASEAGAQQYKVGDQVVVIGEHATLQNGDQAGIELPPGDAQVVRGVDGKLLWFSEAKSGWMDSAEVIALDQATDYIDAKLKPDPTNAKWRSARALLFRKKGNLALAVSEYTDLIEKEPKSAALWNDRGLARSDQEDLEGAIADFSEAIRLDGKVAAYYSNRGEARHAKQDFAGVLADHTEAIRLDPNHNVSFNELGMLYASCPQAKFRDGEKAVTFAKRAVELTGEKDERWIDSLAAAYAEAGKFDEAIQWQTKAIALSPEDEKEDFQSRLELYKQHQPYREEFGP